MREPKHKPSTGAFRRNVGLLKKRVENLSLVEADQNWDKLVEVSSRLPIIDGQPAEHRSTRTSGTNILSAYIVGNAFLPYLA
jgi:hypothetical protein